MGLKCALSRGLAVVCALTALPSLAQITPDAPLRQFLIPMFDDEGFLAWELRGLEGKFISEDESEIVGLDLRIFSGDERALEETRIRSPRARIFMNRSRAEGGSSIFVAGPNFNLAGENWTWEGESRTIIVRQSARVTFDEQIDILR